MIMKRIQNKFSTMTLGDIKKLIDGPVKSNVIDKLSEDGGLCPMRIIIESIQLDPADTWINEGEDNDNDNEETPNVLQVFGRILYPFDRKMEEQQFSTWVEYNEDFDEVMNWGYKTFIFNEPSIEKLVEDRMNGKE